MQTVAARARALLQNASDSQLRAMHDTALDMAFAGSATKDERDSFRKIAAHCFVALAVRGSCPTTEA